MISDPDDGSRDDFSDDELEEIERQLLEAANEHRIKIDQEVSKVEASETETFSKLDELEARAEAMAHRAGLLHEAHSLEGEIMPSKEEREMDERLKAMEAVAARARKTEHSRIAPISDRAKQNQDAAQGLGMGMSIAYAVLGFPILGFVVGKLVDGQSQAKWQSILAIAGIVLGMGFAAFQLSRANKRER